ncbi:hypothetical protein LUZ63_014310 [Rhynchospora breviuscula]|uniref:TF-B3 domain-containing protein n=1 Tax=Rhynchospora breviuscula TaxID=2022672 RepID=A0A9Q0CAF9_9POAL|nr:hypothetical protein LUZ63_014310 [Rhynchospora breviuscula]
MDFSNIHFYKQMSGFFMHSISLPEKMTRQFTNLAGKVLQLKRPSGDTWHVGLMMSGDKLVLQPGWNDFASANKLSQNDHLVFKFIGESKFEVFIFDPTGCEKGGNFENEEQELDESLGSIVGEELSKELHEFDMTEKDEWLGTESEIETTPKNKKLSTKGELGAEASNDSVPIEELRKNLCQKGKQPQSQCKTKIQRSNHMATKHASKKLEEKDEANLETSNDSVPIGKLFQTHCQQSKRHSETQSEIETPPMKRLRKNRSNFPFKKGQERRSLQSCYNNYSSRVQLTPEQKNRVEQLACKVTAGNPFFQTVLRKYNLTAPYRMRFPGEFSAAYLQKQTLEVILCCPDQGKTWFVASHFHPSITRHMLKGTTLGKFMKENKLQEGDLCVFELMVKNAKRPTFAVHISRATSILDS